MFIAIIILSQKNTSKIQDTGQTTAKKTANGSKNQKNLCPNANNLF